VSDFVSQLNAALADRYRVERELGRGGMATVFLAIDLRHKRPVALKVLHPDLGVTLGGERFHREIETAARLQHPHILTIHDSGEAAGHLWFTMPFVEGETLRARLRRERQLPIEDALRITREAAQALQYAHDHGVIHRDIKPENLLLTADGNTLVADFGIARGLAGVDERLTSTGLVLGTPAYMSPEQGAGEHDLDPRTDVYSLGCVLYEMLAGEPPFTAPTMQALIVKRLSGPAPSVSQARPSVPDPVVRAVAKALAPVPADRLATASEFARALDLRLAADSAATVPLRPAPHRRHARRLPALASALLVGFLIGLGVLFAVRRSARSTESGLKLLAVLPFENMSDSADTYFADGVANEVRLKLSQVRGLRVIARSSSNDYRRTTKTPEQIARELGVDYLLTATVQWDKTAAGGSRVRVSPELVDVHPGHAPETRWGQPFDAAMTNVFEVQSSIATQVVQALDVALGDRARDELAARPTQSLPAYDAFLRGEAVTQGMMVYETPANLRVAILAYERAVALDSTFVRAWAQLARARAGLYYSGTGTPEVEAAARTAARQVAHLAPNSAEAHQALAAYYNNVSRDPASAYREDSAANVLAPDNAEILGALGLDEEGLARWEAARGHWEQAVRLDPRSPRALQGLGDLLLTMRQHDEAERTLARALELAPSDLGLRDEAAMVRLARGDLAGARAVINAAPKDVDPTALVAYMATFQDLFWVLDDTQQRLLLRLSPGSFDGDRGGWGLIMAHTYALRGDRVKARAYADSARGAYLQYVAASPQDAYRRVLLGVALAYLGRKADAVREGERAVAALPISKDAFLGPYIQHQLVRIYLILGQPDKALDRLEPLMKMPYFLSPAWLRIDPMFTPLRTNARFEGLASSGTS
jgi:serine/threonine-protein kinase